MPMRMAISAVIGSEWHGPQHAVGAEKGAEHCPDKLIEGTMDKREGREGGSTRTGERRERRMEEEM